MSTCIAIVQARMDSKRFPKKVLKKINGKTVIEILLTRLQKSRKVKKIILATAKKKVNDLLVKHVNKLGFEVYRGSSENVLSRYYNLSQQTKAKYIVRITGDCPLVDPRLVDKMIEIIEKKCDIVSNVYHLHSLMDLILKF